MKLGRWSLPLPLLVASLSAASMVLLVLYLVGRPLATDDLWFHLKMGEAFATEGLWPDADPMLHTAVAEAPIQHEWLFQVFVYEVWQSLGFQGLRAVHVPIVAGIFWLIFAVVRRESRSAAVACFGVALFVVLAWYRLFQFRPDLASIPAAYGLYLLLLEGRSDRAGRRWVARACSCSRGATHTRSSA